MGLLVYCGCHSVRCQAVCQEHAPSCGPPSCEPPFCGQPMAKVKRRRSALKEGLSWLPWLPSEGLWPMDPWHSLTLEEAAVPPWWPPALVWPACDAQEPKEGKRLLLSGLLCYFWWGHQQFQPHCNWRIWILSVHFNYLVISHNLV